MKTILIPVDFSADSINALEHGIKFANTITANIKMVHVVHYKTFETPFYFKDLEDFKDKTVQDFMNLILYRYQAQVNENLDYVLVEGLVSKEVIKLSEEINADYIIMGTHGTSGSESHWMGSNAYKVVSNSNCPVITIRNGFLKKTLSKIVVPIDASKHTRRKLPYAVDIAEIFGAEVHIVGVTETSMSDILKRVESWVNQSVDYLEQRNIKYTQTMLQGSNITDMTIEYAKEQDAELIAIMTEQGEHPVSLLMGAYAQHMVNNSPVPVLTVRPNINNK
jgi:nucleotide-binding universal stress UspA family protein